MEIIKRNGTSEIYNNKKILRAIRKSFESTGKAISDQDIAGMVGNSSREIHKFLQAWNVTERGTQRTHQGCC